MEALATQTAQNTFYMVNAQQLKEVVQGYLEELLLQLKEKDEQSKNDRLITREEAMKVLQVSLSTLIKWEKKGYLLPFRIGRKVNYKVSDIQNVLKGR